MADVPQPLQKLQDYVEKRKEGHQASVITDVEEDYEARINKSLQSLQDQVKQHQAALKKLRTNASQISFDEPSQDASSRLQQLHTITAAYKSLTSTRPVLPLPNSPLPALLALRTTLNTIDQTKTSIKETYENITRARARLRQEEDDLKDAQHLTLVLERKIEKLQEENDGLSQKSPEERAQAMVQEQRQKGRSYSVEMGKLIQALKKFVDEQLAAMLAAEDLGGPVVGDLIDVNQDILKAGFTRQGKPKKAKGESNKVEAERRQRNSQIWGSGDWDSEHELIEEKEAAGADFRVLMEDLLNAAAGDEDTGPYVDIRRESAAVRFLIRAKVARFHPEDARRLRLVNFGEELDD